MIKGPLLWVSCQQCGSALPNAQELERHCHPFHTLKPTKALVALINRTIALALLTLGTATAPGTGAPRSSLGVKGSQGGQ